MTYPGDDLSRRFRNYVFCFEWQCKYEVLLGGVLFFYGGLFLKKKFILASHFDGQEDAEFISITPKFLIFFDRLKKFILA